MFRHIGTRYLLHAAHAAHAAVILGIMPLIGLLCAAYATVAYGATTTVVIGVGDTSILVEGKASPGSLVTIKDGNNIVGTTTTAASGLFSKKLTAVQPGIHRLQIYARDTQNRLTNSIQIEMSATEHFQTDVFAFLPPTLALEQPIINPGQSITYHGSTFPHALVTLVFEENNEHEQTFEIATNEQGEWSQTILTDDLPLGTYEAFAAATDTATAEESYITSPLAVTILLPTPQPPPTDDQPSQPAPTPQPSPRPIRATTIQPPANAVITESPLLIRGTAEPLAQVELFNGGRPVGSTFADKKGDWSIQLALQETEYALRARACTVRACSNLSAVVRLIYQPTGSARQFWIWLRQYAYITPEGKGITLRLYSGNSTAPLTMVTDWGDGSQQQMQQEAQNATLAHTYKRAGLYQGTITATDASGRVATAMFSVRATSNQQAQPMWPLLLATLLAIAFICGGMYIYWRLHRHHVAKD